MKRNFKAEHESEVSVAAGERVEIISDTLNGWSFVVTMIGNRQGYVPTSFLEIEKEEQGQQGQALSHCGK